MAFELILLGGLIFIFIVSFCGLLQKIKQTYDRERILTARIAQRRQEQRARRRSESFTEIYINPSFLPESNGGVYPAAVPPPYTQYYVEPPPKYDDVVKVHQPYLPPIENVRPPGDTRVTVIPEGPPPYSVSANVPNHGTLIHSQS